MQSHTALQYINLGANLEVMRRVQLSRLIAGSMETADQLLGELQLHHSAIHFDQTTKDYVRASLSASADQVASTGLRDKVAEIANAIFRALSKEAAERSLAVLDRTKVSQRLRTLAGCLSNVYQKVIVDDTIRCLEVGAFRAAIVMAWNLTYDYIRAWVFNSPDRLKQFNDVLTQKWKSKTKQYDPIDVYEDFFALGESFVLSICFEATLVPKMKFQTLQQALDQRNHFAHATFEQATSWITNGYIDQLIINIIDDPLFA